MTGAKVENDNAGCQGIRTTDVKLYSANKRHEKELQE